MFDYDIEETKEADVSSVADAIRSSHRLAPLTDEQKAQRQTDHQIRRKQQAFLAEMRKAEREWIEAEKAAEARAKAAAALAERNKALRLQQQERDRESKRDQRLGSLEIRAKQGEIWQSHVEHAARNAVAVRNQQALLVDVEAHFNGPPQPEPEEPAPEYPENPKIGDPDFYEKWKARRPLRSWF